MGWFTADPPPDPKEQVREWRSALRKEMRGLDRQITRIEREEMKIKKSIKDAAKSNQLDSAKVLAKSLVESRRAKNRIHTTKAQINSVSMQIQQQASMARVAGALSKSTEVMELMSSLIRLPEIRQTMMHMSRQITKVDLHFRCTEERGRVALAAQDCMLACKLRVNTLVVFLLDSESVILT
eukprot:TRINITY_DN11461_c0_g1_i5.p1 TRINITY_DN11461_c0_g1~~TRINITY_DN11461_c0_g1_i5.p1  ORF type:complete len:182 (+),score=33.95 TRINITY_DN11461_c0_g1_i5:451-996(+)